MFCHRCGTELPDDAQFCRKCGQSVPGATPAPPAPTLATPTQDAAIAPAMTSAPPMPAPARPKRHIAIYFLLLVLMLAIVWIVYRANAPDRGGGTPLQRTVAQQYTLTMPAASLDVNALSLNVTKFSIPDGAFDARIEGHFTVSGGSGDDIEAYIFDDNSFTAWQDRHVAVPIYNSGRVTEGNIKVSLPAGAGTYWLVFNNRFSLVSAKTVDVKVTGYYSK